MLQNIIIGIIVVCAVVLLIRHFVKSRCSCGCSGSDKNKSGSCGGCSLKR